MTIRTYIVPSGQVTAIRNRLKDTDAPVGLDGMFTTGLSTDGTGSPTHYVSSGTLSDEQVAFLEAELPTPFTRSDGTTIDAEGNVVSESPFELFARLGLKLVQAAI